MNEQPTKKAKKEGKYLNLRLDEEVHRRLKAKSAEEGKSMQDFLDALIRRTLGLPDAPEQAASL